MGKAPGSAPRVSEAVDSARETELEPRSMATAAALIFHDHATAGQALEAARSLERAGQLTFLESGLLVKNQDLSVEMREETWRSEILWGATVGGITGALLLGIPILGAAGGVAAGAYVWKHKESHKAFTAFAEQVKRTIVPGGAAVVALVESTNPDHVRLALGRFGGTLYSTELLPVEIVNIQQGLDKHKS
jgi:uncharacterized membrane protein